MKAPLFGSFCPSRLRRPRDTAILPARFLLIAFFCSTSARVLSQSTVAPFAVTIVLPPKLVAGHPATLAALNSEGKLLAGATLEVGAQGKEIQRITTGATGRAVFTPITDTGIIFAKSPGSSAAALTDAPASRASANALALPSIISRRDRFSICGGEFHGDAEADRVRINGDPALVLAASPECLVVLPGLNVQPGPAKILISAGTAEWSASATVVSLEFDPPNPPLIPLKHSSLIVRVRGTDQPLAIVVENKTPGVLRFLRGDTQELKTSGGSPNTASIEVKTLRSGDFSFQARLVGSPDLRLAERYLAAAAALAGKDWRPRILNLAHRLAHGPNHAAKVRAEFDRILATAPEGDLRTALEAARASI